MCKYMKINRNINNLNQTSKNSYDVQNITLRIQDMVANLINASSNRIKNHENIRYNSIFTPVNSSDYSEEILPEPVQKDSIVPKTRNKVKLGITSEFYPERKTSLIENGGTVK